MSSHSLAAPPPPSGVATFLAGWRAAWSSVFALVLVGTCVGVGALAHDYGFSVAWVLLSTVLVWAAPAQVILLSALGAGATPFAVALAVGLSGVRLLPMVVSLLALLKRPGTRARDLILPAHLTAVSLWVEALRLLPSVPREQRIAFCNGLGIAFVLAALAGTLVGFYLAASLPALLTSGLLFLTPMSFLISTVRNSRQLTDRLALVLGLGLGPLMAYEEVGLDLLWTGVIAGTAAYGVHRLRETWR
ncbi:MAG TPA: AzlC family ABC transporter permease [Xanthobacteraceae bacterium]|jgi:predicted branched-subunit amino acid permease